MNAAIEKMLAEKPLTETKKLPVPQNGEIRLDHVSFQYEAGVKALDDVFEIYTAPNDFSAVREALEQQGLSFLSADVKMIPQNTVSITDEETAAKIEKLLDMLDDNDDVADVYHNAELPESDEEDE